MYRGLLWTAVSSRERSIWSVNSLQRSRCESVSDFQKSMLPPHCCAYLSLNRIIATLAGLCGSKLSIYFSSLFIILKSKDLPTARALILTAYRTCRRSILTGLEPVMSTKETPDFNQHFHSPPFYRQSSYGE